MSGGFIGKGRVTQKVFDTSNISEVYLFQYESRIFMSDEIPLTVYQVGITGSTELNFAQGFPKKR